MRISASGRSIARLPVGGSVSGTSRIEDTGNRSERFDVARIEGVDLPRNKPVWIALTYIYGIGKTTARKLVEQAGLDPSTRVAQLTEHEVARVREAIQSMVRVEGELRKDTAMAIKRLVDMGTYRGTRHRKGLPVRGQRTHTNARTRKGPRKTVAGKKTVSK
jgi:small subunit ribosomal protein S13